MRVALLSDIHGNAAALRAVLADLENQRAEACWILGDVLGYGPLPVTCIRMLDELSPAAWLMGNHDLAVLLLLEEGRTPEDRAVRDLAPGIDERLVALWHAAQIRVGLAEPRIHRLREAATWQRMAPGVYAAHGAMLSDDPRAARNVIGRNSYCKAFSTGCDLTLDRVERIEGDTPARLIVVGHTHIPALGWARPANPGREWNWVTGQDLRFNDGAPYHLEEQGAGPMMLCPGSVGQPRGAGRDNLATYAVVDLEKSTVDFRQVEFDPSETRAAMEPMPGDLHDLLTRGRDR